MLHCRFFLSICLSFLYLLLRAEGSVLWHWVVGIPCMNVVFYDDLKIKQEREWKTVTGWNYSPLKYDPPK